jgi:hypothetical protein
MKLQPLRPLPSIIGILIIGTMLTLLAVSRLMTTPADAPQNVSATEFPSVEYPPVKPPVQAPDLRALAMNLSGGSLPPPTPAQLAEEKRVVAEQVDLAITWLKSSSVQTRIEGSEQLGAYPSPKSAVALVGALRKDSSPEVRLAAAQSLSQSEVPDSATITALLSAIADTDEQVASTALSALEVYLDASPNGSTQVSQIRQGLRTQSRNRRLPAAMRTRLMALLSNT